MRVPALPDWWQGMRLNKVSRYLRSPWVLSAERADLTLIHLSLTFSDPFYDEVAGCQTVYLNGSLWARGEKIEPASWESVKPWATSLRGQETLDRNLEPYHV